MKRVVWKSLSLSLCVLLFLNACSGENNLQPGGDGGTTTTGTGTGAGEDTTGTGTTGSEDQPEPDNGSPGANLNPELVQQIQSSEWMEALPGTDNFGFAVAISGHTLMVSAPDLHNSNPDQGRVLVYELQNSQWNLVQTLTPPNTESPNTERFGFSIALNGDTALIGSPDGFNTDPNKDLKGKAWIFERENDQWVFKSELNTTTTTGNGLFGHNVQLVAGGTVAFISAPGRHTVTLVEGVQKKHDGAVYLFEKEGGEWVEKNKFIPWYQNYNLIVNQGYGFAMKASQDGNKLLVGASVDEGLSLEQEALGAAYYYERVGEEWILKNRWLPLHLLPMDANWVSFGDEDIAPTEMFGSVVALTPSGNDLFVGNLDNEFSYYQINQETHLAELIGVFDPNEAYDNPGQYKAFTLGEWDDQADMNENWLALGNDFSTQIQPTESGSVILIQRQGEGFNLIGELKALGPISGGTYGTSVALSDEFLVVGSPAANRFYVYQLP